MQKNKLVRLKLFAALLSTFIIIVWLIYTGSGTNHIVKTPPRAVDGVIDLRGWNFKEDGLLKLDGQWHYYKEMLLNPMDFNKSFKLTPETLIIPGAYGEHSYGTYRLKLLVDDFETVCSINIDFLQSAYKLWVNGEEIISLGTVGKNKVKMIPQLLPKAGSFHSSSHEVYLTLQVSNFYAKYGFIDTITLGDISQVTAHKNKRLAFDLFLFGCTVMAVIYNLGLYKSRKKNKAPLYFAIVCMIVAVRTMFLGERFFIYLFPEFSYIISGKVMHWTFYLYIPFIVLFMNSFYPRIFSKYIVKLSNLSGLIYAVLVLISPWKYYMSLIAPFEILSILLLLYLIYKVSAVYIKEKGSDYIAVLGLFALFITRVNDILYEFSIIITGSFAPLGTLIFTIAICYVLAHRQSKLLSGVEELSEKLESLHKLKDDFLAITSHELKTPLNGIIGLTEGLTANTSVNLTDEEKQDLLLINSSAKRLSNLVDDVMVFSKLKAGGISLHNKAVNLNKISEMVVRFCELTNISKNLKIINLIDDRAPLVYGDENRIQQIFYNLLGNAIKFTKSGTITLSYGKRGTFIQVHVEDTGIGIPKEKLEKIFEIYGQADDISKNYGGTGLGLYISKMLVELHGGEMNVKSIVGKGSKFSFSLPIDSQEVFNKIEANTDIVLYSKFASDSKNQDKNPVSAETEVSIKETSKILIVDDDYVNQRVLENYLSIEDFTVIKASSGKEALDIIDNNDDLDLIILDMMMPDLLGYEVITIIRDKKSIFELPVLIMTADNRLENLVISFECGANDYLKKPFNKYELLSRVSTLVKLKLSVREALILSQNMAIANQKVEDLSQKNLETIRKVDELMEYDKLKTEFFTNISHELRTPLNVISSTIQLLQSLDPSKTLGDSRNKYYFNIMSQNTLRLLRLINNLIDTTKLDGGYINLNLKGGNIVSFVEDLTQSVAEYVQSKNIEIIFDTEVEEKFITFDEEKVERVMLNILSNAIKFTNENGRIFINVFDRGSEVLISVKDTGIGIPKDKVDYIFERFAQVDRSTTRRAEGSGIGLSIVKALVELHGGTISVKSEVGKGSEFNITLPAKTISEQNKESGDLMNEIPEIKKNKSLSMEFSDIYISTINNE
jgi:two-component system sensor histidine kinase ChiS